MAATIDKSNNCVFSFCCPSISDSENDIELTCYLSQLFDSFVNLVPYDKYVHQDAINSDENINFKEKPYQQHGWKRGSTRQYSLNSFLSTTIQLRESITKERNIAQTLKRQMKKQKRGDAEEKNKDGGSIGHNGINESETKPSLTREELRKRLHAKIEALQQHRKEKVKICSI